MAKRRIVNRLAKRREVEKAEEAARETQTVIPGCEDTVPAEVRQAADEYVKTKRLLAKTREKLHGTLDDLITKMKEADVREMLIDDQQKRLTLTQADKIKIQARKGKKKGRGRKGKGQEDGGQEAEGEASNSQEAA